MVNDRCINWCLFLLLAGCAPRVGADLEYLDVFEEGVPVTVSRGQLDARRVAFELEEVLLLEPDSAIEESYLVRPSQTVMASDGSFCVVDQGDSRIALFDSEGRYQRSFGGKGAGPGEFTTPVLIRFRDDVLTLWDTRQRRSTLYRTDGTMLGVYRVPEDMAGAPAGPPGSFLIPLENRRHLTWHTYSEVETEILLTRREVRIGGGRLDEPRVVTTGFAPSGVQITRELIPGIIERTETTLPFTGSPQIVLTPQNELLTSEGDTPELAWYDLEGKLLRRARLECGPRTFDEAMKRAYRAELEAAEPQSVQRRGQASGPALEERFPEHVGFSTRAVVMDEFGFVWLQGVWGPGELGPDVPVLTGLARVVAPTHVFGPDGRYLGICRIPGLQPTIMRGHVLVTMTDPDTGELIPVVFRIVPVLRGLTYP